MRQSQTPVVCLGGFDVPESRRKRRHESADAADKAKEIGGLRRDRLVALYDQGLSRAQIAGELGISADCVRHLLRRYEVPQVPLWERRFVDAVKGREDEIVAAFLRLRSDAAVASELGIPVKQVRQLVDSRVPEAVVLRRARRTACQLHSDSDLICALRRAALELPSPMAIEPYRAWSQTTNDLPPRPGPEAVILRFGGWRRALASAGLPTNARRGPRGGYEYSAIVQAIAEAWKHMGGYPSVVRYDAWRAGRSDIPVAATARRFARSWDDLLVAAYPLVYATAAVQRSSPTASLDVEAADMMATASQRES